MIKSIESGARGLIAQSIKNDIVANNLANAATSGFRREVARFTQESGEGTASASQLVVSSATDVQGGPVRPTGKNLDVAVDGDGFFVLDTPEGERYTRSGAFQLNDVGELVNESGYRVQGTSGPITVEIQDGAPSVGSDGTISANGASRGQIKVVRFENAGELQRSGGSLFSSSSPGIALDATSVRVQSGFVEDSNINPVREMVSMISALRAYQSNEKSIRSADEILDTMINRVGRAPGA